MRRVGNHLRVTAQLERADNGYQIWSETYDRELGDVFRIQDEIAAAVVKSLKVSLLGAAAPRSTRHPKFRRLPGVSAGPRQDGHPANRRYQTGGRGLRARAQTRPELRPAYVELATAKLQLAEFEITENRQEAANAAVEESKLLIERPWRWIPKMRRPTSSAAICVRSPTSPAPSRIYGAASN